jgi:hypothetical protein
VNLNPKKMVDQGHLDGATCCDRQYRKRPVLETSPAFQHRGRVAFSRLLSVHICHMSIVWWQHISSIWRVPALYRTNDDSDISKHYMNMTLCGMQVRRHYNSDQYERGNGALYRTRVFKWRTMPSRYDRRTRSRDGTSISDTIFSAEGVAVVRT